MGPELFIKRILYINPLQARSGPGTQRGDKYKLKNGVFSLINLWFINFTVPRIKKPVTVHGLRGWFRVQEKPACHPAGRSEKSHEQA